jgi:hypothetical protein
MRKIKHVRKNLLQTGPIYLKGEGETSNSSKET